jgi:hypothetical protein
MSFTHAQILAMEAVGLPREQLLALIKANAQVEEDKAAKRRVGAAEPKRRQRDLEKSRNVTPDAYDTPAPTLDGRPPDTPTAIHYPSPAPVPALTGQRRTPLASKAARRAARCGAPCLPEGLIWSARTPAGRRTRPAR